MVIGSDRLALSPAVDPAATVVVQAGAADVRDVLVAGRVVKCDHVLTGVDRAALRREADASRERIFAAVEAGGTPLLHEPIPGFADALDAMARANLGLTDLEA